MAKKNKGSLENAVETCLQLVGTFIAISAVAGFFAGVKASAESSMQGYMIAGSSIVAAGIAAGCFWAAEMLAVLKDIAFDLEQRE